MRNIDRDTIAALFGDGSRFILPPYQRAYSWEKEQRKQFIEDLREQPQHARYYLGHFIFESSQEENALYIIDGQQRLTTIVLFIAAATQVLRTRMDPDTEELYRIETLFLSDRVSTSIEDQNAFEELVRHGKTSNKSLRHSKMRLDQTHKFFTKTLRQTNTDTILSWIKLIENADISKFVIYNKPQGTQIFILQNSRGKGLTQLEEIKAFLMFEAQLRAQNADEGLNAIRYLERSFSDIYNEVEKLSFNLEEDSVLRFHHHAYSPHWDPPLENVKKIISSSKAENTIEEIKNYANGLAATFRNVPILQGMLTHEELIADPIILDSANSWPLLIKLYDYSGDTIISDQDHRQFLRDLETVLLKFRFQHGRSSNDLISITKALRDEPDDLSVLFGRMRECVKSGFRWRSDFNERFLSHCNGDYHFDSTYRYILWKYENHIRKGLDVQVSPGDYLNFVNNKRMDSTTEHIAPRNGDYSDEFRNKFLNNLGNLLFMPRGMNSSLSDRPPLEKAKLLDTSYASHREVRTMIEAAQKWSEQQILERKEKIVSYITTRWRLNE